MYRVMIGGIQHETNEFNPIRTTLNDFVNSPLGIMYHNEIISKRRHTKTEIGGFIDILEKEQVEIIPSIHGFAMPAGLVTEDVFDEFLSVMFDTIDRNAPDGILLSLHGAMSGVNHDDGEGYILRRIREKAGTDTPIAATLDFHAVLSDEMAKYADFLTVYRTYPHMDMAERGREAAIAMLRILRGEIKPVLALSKQPLLIGPPHNVLPHDYPMKTVMDRAREIETTQTSIISACPAQGFLHLDVPFAGTGISVTADRDIEHAHKYAEELGDLMFSFREEYIVKLPDAEEAIRMAAASETWPVAIADSGDNVGGGTPGDGTALLCEILRQGVDSAFITICDPEAVLKAVEAGIGSRITLAIGGISDPLYGPPVEMTGIVRAISDGRYLNRDWGGYWGGVESNMGLSVRFDCGGITILLNSVRTNPDNIMHAKSIGIFPEDYRINICKGGLAFREAFKPPVSNRFIQSDTPGYSSSNLNNFRFTRIPRPIFPLDSI